MYKIAALCIWIVSAILFAIGVYLGRDCDRWSGMTCISRPHYFEGWFVGLVGIASASLGMRCWKK